MSDICDRRPFAPEDLRRALGLLTRLPGVLHTGPMGQESDRPLACTGWAWPLVGALVGFTAGLVAVLGAALGLPALAAAALAVGAQAMLTGALHEDGLADCADGFWGGVDRRRRLEIMKDSRVGSYGVLALVIVTLARIAAIAALIGAGHGLGALIAAAALSRAPMVLLMAWLDSARPGGLADATGRPGQRTVQAAGLIALALALLAAGLAGIWAALWALAAAALVGALARARIGGQTGDVLGAAQQLAELAALLSLAAGAAG